ncbi:MAG: hypothetical protein LBK72_02145 [Bifidobacteriaceae bacterium]|nr:hypothetical protein [Bifidobacteriaceae bacterium]
MPGSTTEPVSTSLDPLSAFFVDLVPTFLGAFLGFLFALLANTLINNRQKRRSAKNLADELADFLRALHEVFPVGLDLTVSPRSTGWRESVASTAFALAHRIHLPIWESLVATGDLLALRKQDYFDSLIRIYVLILELRSRVNSHTFTARTAGQELRDDALLAIHQSEEDIIALARDNVPLRALLAASEG